MIRVTYCTSSDAINFHFELGIYSVIFRIADIIASGPSSNSGPQMALTSIEIWKAGLPLQNFAELASRDIFIVVLSYFPPSAAIAQENTWIKSLYNTIPSRYLVSFDDCIINVHIWQMFYADIFQWIHKTISVFSFTILVWGTIIFHEHQRNFPFSSFHTMMEKWLFAAT